MLKIQNQLFFKSTMRTVLAVLWFIGSIVYYIYAVRYFGMEDMVTWGSEGVFFLQLRGCFFYFVVMAFLSFDYFREIPDSHLSEIVQATGQSFQNDCRLAVIMLQPVLLSAVVLFSFGMYSFHISSGLTGQMVWYLLKVSGLYMGVSGILAVLLGWFLARRVSKLIGYVGLLLFAIGVSMPMVQNIKLLCWGRDSRYLKLLRILFIMPELDIPNDGGVMIYDGNLYPVQLSQVSRMLFWISILGIGIISCYSIKLKKGIMMMLLCAGTGSLWFVVQPTNAWCDTNAFDETDSAAYILEYYDREEVYQEEKEANYKIDRYNMKITPGWEMRAVVELHFTDSETKVYDMTLYHLYEVDGVMDLTGKTLKYERKGDYLTIQGETQSLDGVIITYHGGNSCFYCNRNDIYLPAWFPYYPIVGFHSIYDKEEGYFIDNLSEKEAQFDITFLSGQEICSDLPEIEKNHFTGTAKGAMFVSGFFKCEKLENGITCIYTYLNPSLAPDIDENREVIEEIAKCMMMSGIWADTQNKTIFLAPDTAGSGILYRTENALAGSGSWEELKNELYILEGE